jgi:hypothetical protein
MVPVGLQRLERATQEQLLLLVKHVKVGAPCTVKGLHKGIAGAQQECRKAR